MESCNAAQTLRVGCDHPGEGPAATSDEISDQSMEGPPKAQSHGVGSGDLELCWQLMGTHMLARCQKCVQTKFFLGRVVFTSTNLFLFG